MPAATDKMLLMQAAEFAARRHHGQLRGSLTTDPTVPYVQHCFEVAATLSRYGVDDSQVLCAAILHDVVEDTETTITEVRDCFGDYVATLVGWLTLPPNIDHYQQKHAHQLKMMGVMNSAGRLIKIADKAANVRGLVEEPPKWSRKAFLGYAKSAHEVVHAADLPSDWDYKETREALIDYFDLCYTRVIEMYGEKEQHG